MTRELSNADIETIKKQAREKLGLCRKNNDIIGENIFYILNTYGRIIFYPLRKDGPWGFTRVSGSSNDVFLLKPFVVINSSIELECQVFAAAHELYHIWFETKPDYLPANLLVSNEISEKKANRFAAEFLIDEQVLKQELGLLKYKTYTVKNILYLASIFTVPYETMVKRLFEIGEIKQIELNKFLCETKQSLNAYKKRIMINKASVKDYIMLDNLVDLSIKAYEKSLISYEKLEYLLALNNLTPSDFCINKEYDLSPLDDEIEEIMKE